MLWTEKHAPKALDEVVGQPKAVRRVREWAAAWKKHEQGSPLLLWGGTGCGKTTIAHAAAEEFGFELFETNAGDVRDKQTVSRLVGNAAVSRTIFGKPRLLLIDEAEGFYGNRDRGGMSAVIEALKTTVCPIILTSNDAWDPKLSPLRGLCELVKLGALTTEDVSAALRRIAEAEKVRVEEEAFERIAEKSKGDLRAAVNDFQSMAIGQSKLESEDVRIVGERDREEEMLETVRVILKTLDFHESRRAFDALNEEPDFVLKWVEENLPREYGDADDLCKGFESLSRADVFLGRTRKRQVYVFWKYAADLMSAGVSLSKSKRYSSFVKYGFPGVIRLLSRTRSERALRTRVGQKIGNCCHISARQAIIDYLPFVLQAVSTGHAEGVASFFDFDAEELEFLGVQDADKVVEKAAELRASMAKELEQADRLSKWFQ